MDPLTLFLLVLIAFGYFVLRDLIGPRNAAIVALCCVAALVLFVLAGGERWPR